MATISIAVTLVTVAYSQTYTPATSVALTAEALPKTEPTEELSIRPLTDSEREHLAAGPVSTPGWPTYEEGDERPISMGAEDAHHEIWWWMKFPLPCFDDSFINPWIGNIQGVGEIVNDFYHMDRWTITDSLTGYDGEFQRNGYYQFDQNYLFFSPWVSMSVRLNIEELGDGGAVEVEPQRACGTLAYGTKPGEELPSDMLNHVRFDVSAELIEDPERREGSEDYTHFAVNNTTEETLNVVVHGNNMPPNHSHPHHGFTRIIADPDWCCPSSGLPPQYHTSGDTFWVTVFRDGMVLPSAALVYRDGLEIGDTVQINVSQQSN